LVAVKGGYWALIHGAQDRVHGSPAGHFADNNHFAVANLMALPLLFYFMSGTRNQAIRWLLGITIGFGLVAVLSSWSRGGLLALAATAIVLSSTSRRRWSAMAVAGSLGLAAVALMPDAWLARMETIASAGKEASAGSRLTYWEIGLEAGAERPLWGWGFDSYAVLTGGAEWHSSYVQVFAEHGLPGSALWLSLLLGSILLLARDVLRPRADPLHPELPALSRALLASLIAFAVGGAFLGIAYWDILYHLIAIAVLLRKIQYVPPPAAFRARHGAL
jgi:probable O-glycosylation ligase (exosortase A-associated)